jgi:hypothetical protein
MTPASSQGPPFRRRTTVKSVVEVEGLAVTLGPNRGKFNALGHRVRIVDNGGEIHFPPRLTLASATIRSSGTKSVDAIGDSSTISPVSRSTIGSMLFSNPQQGL